MSTYWGACRFCATALNALPSAKLNLVMGDLVFHASELCAIFLKFQWNYRLRRTAELRREIPHSPKPTRLVATLEIHLVVTGLFSQSHPHATLQLDIRLTCFG